MALAMESFMQVKGAMRVLWKLGCGVSAGAQIEHTMIFNLRNNVLPYQNPVLFCSRSKGFIVMNASKSTCMRKLGFHRYEMYEKVSIDIKKVGAAWNVGKVNHGAISGFQKNGKA